MMIDAAAPLGTFNEELFIYAVIRSFQIMNITPVNRDPAAASFQ
jgi:hypothetical protein